MRKSWFAEQQTMAILRDADKTPSEDVAKKHVHAAKGADSGLCLSEQAG
jgi:hypothetical protein